MIQKRNNMIDLNLLYNNCIYGWNISNEKMNNNIYASTISTPLILKKKPHNNVAAFDGREVHTDRLNYFFNT